MAEIIRTVDPKNLKTQAPKAKQSTNKKPQEKKLRRADDGAARREANSQQLQELQYIKGQLRQTKDALDEAVKAALMLKADVKAAVDFVYSQGTAEGVTVITNSDEFSRLVRITL